MSAYLADAGPAPAARGPPRPLGLVIVAILATARAARVLPRLGSQPLGTACGETKHWPVVSVLACLSGGLRWAPGAGQGIGGTGAAIPARGIFSRPFADRRQLGFYRGLTPSGCDSGAIVSLPTFLSVMVCILPSGSMTSKITFPRLTAVALRLSAGS